jgi:tetratricopeptide (TPR) repeat protein
MGSPRRRVSAAGTRRGRAAAGRESLEERWLLEAQTARNLEAMAAEQAGQIDEAIALYERNAAEGFAGDLPYGRLVALYERRAAFDQAERVLRRAIEVFDASTRRTAQDRRATIRVFKNRLQALLKRRGSGGTVC